MTCVLYVDDSPSQLESVQRALATIGVEVRTAMTVDEAIECLRDGRVELGLIDYHLPGASGAEVLQRLRTRAKLPTGLRFYIYTTDNRAQADYREHGFQGAILRKGDTQSLLGQLEPVLRLLQLHRLARS